MHHLSGAGWVEIAVGAFCVWLLVFIAGWAMIGWGLSIAVRSYRCCMRRRAYPGYHRELLDGLDTPNHLTSR